MISLISLFPDVLTMVYLGPDFVSVFNLQLWASNAKLMNFYMIFGYVLNKAYICKLTDSD